MALEATHIRFALDLKDKNKVSDIKKYLSGTVYPDSRYVSEIDRHLTHPEDFMDEGFIKNDDFRKGWAVHLLCDKIQVQITRDKLPEIFELETGQGSPRWIHHTALKILQDIDDVQKFDIKKYLPDLDYVEAPNGEDPKIVLRYNQIFQNMYKDPAKTNIDSCYEMWKLFGIGDELATKVKLQAEAYSKDKRIMDFIGQIYNLMLGRAK